MQNWKTIGAVIVRYAEAHQIWNGYSYILIQNQIFDNLYQAVAAAQRHITIYDLKYGRLPKYWEEPSVLCPVRYEIYKGDRAIFIDECGLTIPIWRIWEEYQKLPNYVPRYWRRKHFKFRDGPVPYIRKSRGGGGYWRRPKTTQENREIDFTRKRDEDIKYHKVKLRARRFKLPSRWDDQYRADRGKSWKKHRSHQWKPKRN